MAARSAKNMTPAQRESERGNPEAPAAVPAPKGSYRVVGTLWRDRRQYRDGDTITLTDAQAAELGDAVVKL